MTGIERSTLHGRLAGILGCEADQVEAAASSVRCELAAIFTVADARKALGRVHTESAEYHAILSRWVELSTTIEELSDAHVSTHRKPELRAYVELKMVMLCATPAEIRRAGNHVTPRSIAWPALVSRGLLTLRTEARPDLTA